MFSFLVVAYFASVDNTPAHACLSQGGTDTVDNMEAATFVEDGSVVLAGYTAGDWGMKNLGNYDFAAVKLSADTGEELSRFQVPFP